MLACAAQQAQGVDLTKIPRTIVKEPAYQSKTPKYCLVVFGAEAKTRIWLVIDGETLYVDRNGDGDLTGPLKQVANNPSATGARLYFKVGRITAADRRSHYEDIKVLEWEPGRVSIYHNQPKVGNDADVQRGKDLQFADRPQDAPIVHFDGPLTLQPATESLIRSNNPCPLVVEVGTPGLGRGTFTALRLGPTSPSAVADISFPNRAAGGKPIVVKVPLHPPK
jgi:hypothetical protein